MRRAQRVSDRSRTLEKGNARERCLHVMRITCKVPFLETVGEGPADVVRPVIRIVWPSTLQRNDAGGLPSLQQLKRGVSFWQVVRHRQCEAVTNVVVAIAS